MLLIHDLSDPLPKHFLLLMGDIADRNIWIILGKNSGAVIPNITEIIL